MNKSFPSLLTLFVAFFVLTFSACSGSLTVGQPDANESATLVAAFTPEPTMVFTPTPPLKARLNVPVSNGARQMITRSVQKQSKVSQGFFTSEQTWHAKGSNQYLLIEGDHRGLNDNTDGVGTVIFGWLSQLSLSDGSTFPNVGQGVKDQFCADCQGLVLIDATGTGNTTYLFEVPDTLNASSVSFEYPGFSPVELVAPDWMPKTFIPALEGVKAPAWGPVLNLTSGSRLTYTQFDPDGGATFWAVDRDGQSEFQFPTETVSYGWAKYSPDGNRVLILTQPEIGWMDLYLYNATGTVRYPIVEDAEWIQADFSLDGKSIYFSVIPIGSSVTRLYRISVDGNDIQEISLDDELLYFKPTGTGDLAVVTTDARKPAYVLAGSAPFTDSDFSFFSNKQKLSLLKAENPEKLNLIVEEKGVQVVPGNQYWLVEKSGDVDQVLIQNVEDKTSKILTSNGGGCISPDDSMILTRSSVDDLYALFLVQNPNQRQTIMGDVENLSSFIDCQFSADAGLIWLLSYVKLNEDDSIQVLFLLDDAGNVLNRVDNVETAGFSPDGTQIAYTVHQDKQYQLFLADSDGGNEKLIGNGLFNSWLASP